MKIENIIGETLYESESSNVIGILEDATRHNADLRNADLRNADLGGADLHNADLHNADLRNADLRNADLGGADLHNADLRNADLHNADLYNADLHNANLRGANLGGAYLRGANLHGADLGGADLHNADLHNADLHNADLYNADLHNANLRGANLGGAYLRGANLHGAKYADFAIAQTRILAAGTIIGWKKAADHSIVKLRIPEDAQRSHGNGRKCRAERAEVLEIYDANGTEIQTTQSCWDKSFNYRVGETVTPTEPFDTDQWNECSSGIHFFITREEAENFSI